MLFNSLSFLIFFPVVVLLYGILPKKLRAPWLLIASYYFYMSWNAKYAALIALSTATTWLCGLIIGDSTKKTKKDDDAAPVTAVPAIRRKAALIAVIVINLGILFFFKYFGFAVDTLNGVLGLFHAAPVTASLNVLLPVGISFYTFQALGYTFDVYKGRIEPEKSFLRYALFVSFFPQLVAGPIERSERLLKQIDHVEEIRFWQYDRIVTGLITMCWGLFMKMVIADRIAIIADTVFDAPYGFGTFELIAGMLAFTLQIYCDFNAYSTIAIGAAKVMGFSLMDNFHTPYFAETIADFWRRWHISLSTWFRDYVYIPLGGNRCSRTRRYFNLMVTFLVSGLWHGASMSFVVWGGVHGILQIAEDLLKKPLAKAEDLLHVNRDNFSYHFGKIMVTFSLVSIAWIFFRAQTLKDAVYYIHRMFTRWNPWVLFNEGMYQIGLDRFEMNILIVSLVALLLVDLLWYFRQVDLAAFLMDQGLWFRWAVVIVLIVCILVYGIYGVNFDSTQFIYFDF
ncbi:MAG: MBOAT family protein [Lachnospiraceae bacterium]|nr:MBOAT family protein [Lachnospiraceae bacterium]